jgi:hypothetical protein
MKNIQPVIGKRARRGQKNVSGCHRIVEPTLRRPKERDHSSLVCEIHHLRSTSHARPLLAHATVVSAADAETGFVSIFNGKDLTGWDGNRNCGR